jgi:Protein of unknown function (DUF2726)
MIKQILAAQPATAAAILFVAIMVGVFLERWRAWLARQEHRQRKGWSRNHNWRDRKAKLSVVPKPDTSPADFAAEQLKVVMNAQFSRRPLLNQKELRVFAAIEKLLDAESAHWRLMAQVSLGEIVGSADKAAYLAINSKRVDLLLVDGNGNPLHAIEYQGTGHHQGTAAARDAVKKEALRRAGIGYVEVVAGDRPEDLKAMIAKLIRQAKT